MKKAQWHRIFSPVIPPAKLKARILARVSELERAHARVRAGIFGLIAAASAVLLVPLAQYTFAQFYASGFASYLSLLISDQGLVITYWREFVLSLVESLPSIALLMLLPVAAALVWALRGALRSVRIAYA